MTIRKPNEKVDVQDPKTVDLQKMQEVIEKLDKKIDKLFKVLDYRFTSK